MNTLKKYAIPLALILFIGVSAATGYLGYRVASNFYDGQTTMENFPWLLEPDKSYRYLSVSDDEKNFTYESEDGSILYTLNKSGQILREEKIGQSFYDKYAYVEEFHHGFAIANRDGWGNKKVIVNRTGKIVYEEEKTQGITYVDGTSYLLKHIDGDAFRYEIRDIETGDSKMIEEALEGLHPYGDGQYIGKKDGLWGFLDEDFRFIEGGQLYQHIGPLSEGLRYVVRAEGQIAGRGLDEEIQYTKGYEDASGKLVFKLGKSTFYGGPFSQGKALIYGNRSLFAVDRSGKEQFRMAVKLGSDDWRDVDTEGPIFEPRFFGNYAPVMIDNYKYGIIDAEGNFAAEPVFYFMEASKEGLCAVTFHGESGILDLREGF